jgi:hypothetical protein
MARMKRRRPGLASIIVPFAFAIAACSGSGAGPTTLEGTGGAGDKGGAAGAPGMTGATGAAGAAGATETTGVAGAGGAAGAIVTTGAAGAAGATGGAGTTGAGGAAGSPPIGLDGSVDDATTGVDVFPSTETVKMMVVGSSNEIGTCWRAFLWRELRMDDITNFDFVGQQHGGPDCGVPGYDMDLQAMSGIIITNIPASTYAGWFKANPPQVILMHFGGADLLANMPIDGVMKAYSTALAQARLVNPNVVLLIAQHTPEGKDTVPMLNADIATWAVQNDTPESPVRAVDLYTGILPSDLSDGVHLNLVGAQKVADRWTAALLPFFKP